jgi:2-keto-4-pentenoate hydratase
MTAEATIHSMPPLKKLAMRKWRDYQCGTPGTAFADPGLSLTLEEAYHVQMEVARLRCADGDMIVGYKVGCIGPGVVEQFGMSGPIHARLFRSEIRSSGQALRHAAYANLAIEGEMALRVGADGQIVAAFPVIELHHFVFRAPQKTLAELVANNGINAGAVLPNRLKLTTPEDWEKARKLSVAVNGITIDEGPLWAMAGGAVEAVEWLRSDLHRFGEGLNPGDIILAGTPLGLHPVQVNDHVVVSIDGRDCVDCRVV